MGAAIGGRDGVAVETGGAFAIVRPGTGPFDRALVVGEIGAAGEQFGRDHFAVAEAFAQMVGKAAGELENRGFGGVAIEQRRRRLPADFDAAEQIGLGTGELVEAAGAKARVVAEDLRVG